MVNWSSPRPLKRLAEKLGTAALMIGMVAAPAAAAAQKEALASAQVSNGATTTAPFINIGTFPDAELVDQRAIMTMADATTPNYLTTRNTLDRDIGIARTRPDDEASLRLVAWADQIQLARQIKDPMAREQAVQDIAVDFFSYDTAKGAIKSTVGTEWEHKPWDQSVQQIVETGKGSVCQEFADLVTETGLRVNGNPKNVGVVTLHFIPTAKPDSEAWLHPLMHANGFANVDGRIIIHEQDGMYDAGDYFGGDTMFQPGQRAQVESVETISAVNRYLITLSANVEPPKSAAPRAIPYRYEAEGQDAKILDDIEARKMELVQKLVQIEVGHAGVPSSGAKAVSTPAPAPPASLSPQQPRNQALHR